MLDLSVSVFNFLIKLLFIVVVWLICEMYILANIGFRAAFSF